MVGKKKELGPDGGREAVKLLVTVVEKVRAYKKKTGFPICIFIERAIDEKLEREKIKKT